MSTILTTENLSLFYGKKEALKGINIDFDDKGITALIG
ncbi:MAG: phosphate ABC transporter ATP-binding protein, partial [Lactiplantibacillus plantarum]|nr:phosphate ABC transporter ATP-binding protein [Lactiplantibacillus plantarum]